MKVDSKVHAERLILTITGHITGIVEVNEIKHIIDSYENITTLELDIKDAFVMPSALIGYLVKLHGKDGKNIYIKSIKELRKLLIDLDLDQIFYFQEK